MFAYLKGLRHLFSCIRRYSEWRPELLGRRNKDEVEDGLEETVLDEETASALAGKLKEKLDTVEHLKTTLTINEIEDFAGAMSQLAEEYDYPPIAKWAEEVSDHASMFDIDGLTESLMGYEQLLRVLASHQPDA